GWRAGSERRAFALGLAHALEREFSRAVAIVTVTTHARSSAITTRPERPDTVVLGEAKAAAALHARVASEVATRVAQVPVVLLARRPGPGRPPRAGRPPRPGRACPPRPPRPPPRAQRGPPPAPTADKLTAGRVRPRPPVRRRSLAVRTRCRLSASR